MTKKYREAFCLNCQTLTFMATTVRPERNGTKRILRCGCGSATQWTFYTDRKPHGELIDR